MNKRARQRQVPKRPHSPASQQLGARRVLASVTRGAIRRGGMGIVWLDRPIPSPSDFTQEQWRQTQEMSKGRP
jgi:hypothetical protein